MKSPTSIDDKNYQQLEAKEIFQPIKNIYKKNLNGIINEKTRYFSSKIKNKTHVPVNMPIKLIGRTKHNNTQVKGEMDWEEN